MIKPKKKLGQNFLKNKGVIKKIISASGVSSNDTIIEIGPGLGILTKELAKHSKKVIALELDNSLIPILEKELKDLKNLKLIHTDALEYIPKIKNYKIIANIPYYITSPLINHFLQTKHKPKSLTLLIQKEVAEKICEKKKHSVLSLQVQLFGEPKIITKVSPGSFNPPPKVDSAVIHIKVDPKVKEPLRILDLAKVGFTHKRKLLFSTLKKYLKINKEDLTQVFLQASIDFNSRPENLSIKNWEDLSRSIKKL